MQRSEASPHGFPTSFLSDRLTSWHSRHPPMFPSGMLSLHLIQDATPHTRCFGHPYCHTSALPPQLRIVLMIQKRRGAPMAAGQGDPDRELEEQGG
ncbi:hypothetical protein FKM82_008467 [Ascaphus truei]